jgi:hypothetical protein
MCQFSDVQGYRTMLGTTFYEEIGKMVNKVINQCKCNSELSISF